MSDEQLEQFPCSMDYIRKRCDECDDCWEWRGGYRAGKWPQLHLRRPSWDGVVRSFCFYVKHLTWWHHHGSLPKLGKCRALVSGCGNPKCVNPEHLKIVSRATVTRQSYEDGRNAITVSRRRNMAVARRKRSQLSDEDIATIRLREAPAKFYAERYGISNKYVYQIWNGEWRKDYSNPFALLMR